MLEGISFGFMEKSRKPNESASMVLSIDDTFTGRGIVPDSNQHSPVSSVLAQMDRHAQRVRLTAIGAAMMEGLLMVVALLKIDWKNDTHVLMFIFAVLGYTIIALGLAALGAHVSRVGARVVAALDERDAA